MTGASLDDESVGRLLGELVWTVSRRAARPVKRSLMWALRKLGERP